MLEPDFSGWATKNGILCTDGRTIMPDAFKHQDKAKVPLVWSHFHDSPETVLGHGILTNKPEGVWVDAYFNKTVTGQNAKLFVQNGDIDTLSIHATQLRHQANTGNVIAGNIVEVSLVLAGANKGAKIESVSFRHSADADEPEEDSALIMMNLPLETLTHSDNETPALPSAPIQSDPIPDTPPVQDTPPVDETPKIQDASATENSSPVEDPAPAKVNDAPPADENLSHAETNKEGAAPVADSQTTVKDIYDAFTEEQKNVVAYLIGEAIADASGGDTLTQSELAHQEGYFVPRNVFDDQTSGGNFAPTLSHAALKDIMSDAMKTGSLKESFLSHVDPQEYGIENIDILFPDAKLLSNSPEIIGRRTEWVTDVINGTKHSPISRIKSTAVDLTADEARAKGYVKGNLKKDEIIKLLKRITTPTTIYKKQKLDRDDIVDIVDLDVVAWLKAEMRVMLDEELARAVLVGDGREADDEDKIDADHIRPIAYDDDMYAHKVRIQDGASTEAIVEGVLRARSHYKGTGTPTMYTTDEVLTDLILQKDKMGRRLYTSEADLAAAMRVNKIVTVEVLNDTPDILAIIVNLVDYTLGADTGGKVSMFDDFDIDYNQFKYLIETRVSGALTKPKSAVVVNRAIGTIVTPQTPSYNGTTKTVTYPAQAGVVYRVDGISQTGDVVIDEATDIEARPATGYTFPAGSVTEWTYVP